MQRFRVDPWLLGATLLGLALRWAPLVEGGVGGCERDGCSYRNLARGIVRGEGLQQQEGWLWAPGYPYLLAGFEALSGSLFHVKWFQGALGAASVVLAYLVAARLADRRTARVAAVLVALHPTLAYFASTLFSEAVYSFLLLAAVWSMLWARDGTWRRALLPGLLVGVCVLFRGVAQYMAPIFVVALLWPEGGLGEQASAWFGQLRDSARARWRHGVAVLLAAFVVVAPYSMHASERFGGFVLSDATKGQMMWLGNNDYEPITFDYGNGMVRNRVMKMYQRHGRPHCPSDDGPVAFDACETERATEWIRENPGEFVARVPVRVAQMLNPNSFLTRHLRWGRWKGVPWLVKEGLVAGVILMSLLVTLGGTVGAWARGRGPYALLASGIVIYHLAAIALLAGMTRYRLPLEPLWLVYAAMLISAPRATLSALRDSPWRAVGCVVSLAVLLPLVLWYLPTGFPSWF